MRPNSISHDRTPFNTIVRVGDADNLAGLTAIEDFDPETKVLSWSGTISDGANKVFHAHQNDVLHSAGDADRIEFEQRNGALRGFRLKQSPASKHAFSRFWLSCTDPRLHEERVSRLGPWIKSVAVTHSAPTAPSNTPAYSHGELP